MTLINKILIIQQKMIGDVLTSSILCEAIKQRFPKAEVHYLINSHTLPVIENNPFIDKKIVYTAEIAKSRKAKKELRKELKSEGYNAVVDVYSKIGSARMAKSTKAPIIVGYKKWYTKSAYTDVYSYNTISETEAGIAIENRMMLLQAIDTGFSKALKPKLYVTDKEIAFAKEQLLNHQIDTSKPLYMIGILGSSDSKTYPLPYLAEVLDYLVEKTDGQLLFNYIPNQVNQVDTLYELCAKNTQLHIKKDLYGKSLREFIALTSQCDALIGNEGGAINMAKAINIPTFSIFSPWIMRAAWALYENKHNVVVHLEDINPELYKEMTLRQIQKKWSTYYKAITPDFAIQQLSVFLKSI